MFLGLSVFRGDYCLKINRKVYVDHVVLLTCTMYLI